MNNVKKIAILSLVVAVMTGFTQAATHHHESKPDATLRLSSGGFALGIGVNWGSGTLTYRGKDYPVKVKGRGWRGDAGRDSWRWENWHHHVKSGWCDSPHFLDTKRHCCQRDWGRR
jgi:hypothetical protein